MRALDGLFVDRIDFLPQVFGGRGDEGCGRIDMPRNFEYTRSDGGEDCLDGSDDAVIERMNRAGGFRLADATGDQRLDAPRLDLDVDDCPVSNDLERFVERRNASTVSEREPLEVGGRQVDDRPMRWPLRMPGVHHRIVVDDNKPVMCSVDVELYAIGAELDGALERRKRVLWMGLVCPAVSDALRRIQTASCSQASLQVVAL